MFILFFWKVIILGCYETNGFVILELFEINEINELFVTVGKPHVTASELQKNNLILYEVRNRCKNYNLKRKANYVDLPPTIAYKDRLVLIYGIQIE